MTTKVSFQNNSGLSLNLTSTTDSQCVLYKTYSVKPYNVFDSGTTVTRKPSSDTTFVLTLAGGQALALLSWSVSNQTFTILPGCSPSVVSLTVNGPSVTITPPSPGVLSPAALAPLTAALQKKLSQKDKIIIGVVIALVVAAILGGLLYYSQRR